MRTGIYLLCLVWGLFASTSAGVAVSLSARPPDAARLSLCLHARPAAPAPAAQNR